MSLDAETIKKAVKPLEWIMEQGLCPGPSYKAVGGNIGYRIYDHLSDNATRYKVGTLGVNIYSGYLHECGALDAAKAAAQADYEARILSALSPEFLSALDTQSSRTEAMRKALEAAADQLERVHDDAFTQAAGYGLVTSDGRDFSCFQLNVCSEAAGAARAALSTSNPGDADGWRAIETAQKDGTVIHVWASGFQWPEAVRWEDYSAELAEELAEDGYWTYAEDLMADATESCEPETWTHWRPLPAPPASSHREGEGK